jgi:putative phosphoserine phosphatase/1-acylglycerol-3-phosphate O-acyltransferase
VSPRLAPFKKGAFHLAMQAGVPMVPIVIHNAGDVAPKGDFVFRPATVEVDVLPPVDTSGWRAETIDEHVAEVRRRFQETLRYDRESGEQAPAAPAEATPEAPVETPAPLQPLNMGQPLNTGQPLKKKLRKKKKASGKASRKPTQETSPAAVGKKAPRKKPHKKKVGVKTATGKTVQAAAKGTRSA